MANEAEKFGLPQVVIDFKTKSVSAIARSARGIGVMILNNETTNTSNFYKINDVTDIPDTGLTERCSRRVKFAKLRRSKNANSGRLKFANLSQSKRANHKISTAQIGCSGYG